MKKERNEKKNERKINDNSSLVQSFLLFFLTFIQNLSDLFILKLKSNSMNRFWFCYDLRIFICIYIVRVL